MVRITEMKDAELLALTDEQVIKLIDYECALAGVPMLPANPGQPPAKSIPEPDTTCYEVGGVVVTDMLHATRILEAIASGNLFGTAYTGSDYNRRYLTPLKPNDYSYPKMETKSVYSPEQWDRIKDEISQHDVLKKVYDQSKKAYDEALKERAGISEDAWDRISEARNRKYERDAFCAEFGRYMELPEQNQKVAMNFLLKARPQAKNDYPDLIEELCPGYGAPEVQRETAVEA